jgi:hypothetical protein
MIAFGPVFKGFSTLAELLTMKGVPETIGLITGLVGTFITTFGSAKSPHCCYNSLGCATDRCLYAYY